MMMDTSIVLYWSMPNQPIDHDSYETEGISYWENKEDNNTYNDDDNNMDISQNYEDIW